MNALNREKFLEFTKYFLLAVMLPNIFFLIPAIWLELGRPYVNLDYLLAAVLVATSLRWFGYIFLLMAIFADILLLVGQVFVFVRMQDVFYLLSSVFMASGVYQAMLVGALFVVLSVIFLFRYIGVVGNFAKSIVVLNIGLCFYMFTVYGGEETRNRFWRVAESALVSSQLVEILDYRTRGFVESYSLDGEPFSTASYNGQPNDWFKVAAVERSDKLLLIVNESWGVARDPRINSALMEPVTRLRGRVNSVGVGSMRFVGATVAGELRELCRLRPNHFNLMGVVEGFENCLPLMLRNAGYKTRAMHGAMGTMYDRIHWYPRAGFDQVTFYESQSWPARCYSFPGACDLDLMSELPREFAQPGKRFFYWLTLNTHTMYDARDIRRDVFDCDRYGVDAASESCRYLKLQAQFFAGLADVLQDERMAGVEVLVVGDHAPPIFVASEKARYFENDQVSWLHFKVE